MLESVNNIAYNGKYYNWVDHIIGLLKENYEKYQEAWQSIIFLSLLIWMEMKNISLVSEVSFSSIATLSMKHFQCFSPK